MATRFSASLRLGFIPGQADEPGPIRAAIVHSFSGTMMQEGSAGAWAERGRPPGAGPRGLRGRFGTRGFRLDECQIRSAAPGRFFSERDQVCSQSNFRSARVGLQQTAQLIPSACLSRRGIGQHRGDDLGGLQAYPPYPAVLRLAFPQVRGRILL
jgi:hypothetical protein